MTFLQLTGLHKTYGIVAAVAGVELSVPTGSRTAIVGPSGSGKTTLLRLIAGFDRPDAGSIALNGTPLANESTWVPGHLRGIGVVAQEGALFPHLTIAENIGFGLSDSGAARSERILQLLSMVGLDHGMLRRMPDQLSGGQQQRVALARALARKPRLMLLDEPFSALDTGLRASTRKAVTEVLDAEGITTILVTHDQAEALAFADQLGVMRDGRLVQVGPPREIYSKPRDPLTAVFLGDAVILPATIVDGHACCALGRIEVEDRPPHDQIQIMVRSEQITAQLVRDASSLNGSSVQPVVGTVESADFSGATYNVTVHVPTCNTNGAELQTERSPVCLRLEVSSRDIIRRGDCLHISVYGAAHVFR